MRNPKFNALIDEITRLHESKNHDYTPDGDPLQNLRRAERFGLTALQGVLVRLSDKWSRLEQLTAGKVPKHESVRDTLMDNAVYSLLAILLLDEAASTPIEGTARNVRGAVKAVTADRVGEITCNDCQWPIDNCRCR